MPYRIGSNTVITEGDASPASANGSFRNFFYRYGLSPATYPGTVGSNYGYVTAGIASIFGGTVASPGIPSNYYTFPLYYTNISSFTTTTERFPFAVSVNAVQVAGVLSTTRASHASQSSKTAGYNSGGYLAIPSPNPLQTPNSYFTNVASTAVIDSFPFVSMGIISVSSAGNLSTGRFACAGQQSDTAGFTSGGASSNSTLTSTIDNFPFSSFTTATSVGNLSGTRLVSAGHSSSTSGYTSGGFSPFAFATNIGSGASPPATALNVINRYSFSVSPVTASSVATLTTARGHNMGTSSTTTGYSCGGGTAQNPGFTNGSPNPSVNFNTIERFNFSEQTVTSAVNTQTLNATRMGACGVSSSEYGYICGGFITISYGWPNGPVATVVTNVSALSTIDRFPFASTILAADATNSLATGKGNNGGNQY